MSKSYCFTQQHPWALLPVDRKANASTADSPTLFEGFRYVRNSRRKENCWPWRAAEQMGWDVASPVDVVVEPLNDVEITAGLDQDEILAIAGAANLKEIWRRGDSHIAFPSSGWLRLFDFKSEDRWMPMFTPNGQGSVEWNLGWSVEMPADMGLLIGAPAESKHGLHVPSGVIVAKRAQSFTGFSLAVEIRARTVIRRGDVIARLLPISLDSLKVSSTFVPHGSGTASQRE